MRVTQKRDNICECTFAAAFVAYDGNQVRVQWDIRSMKPGVHEWAAVSSINANPIDVKGFVLIDAIEFWRAFPKEGTLCRFPQGLEQPAPCWVGFDPGTFARREITIATTVIRAVALVAMSIAA